MFYSVSQFDERINTMTKPLHPVAIFRVMLLGPLISREKLSRGELKSLIEGIASHTYTIPESRRIDVSPKACATAWEID